MNILVLNCGSSSLKFQIIEIDAGHLGPDGDRRLASGLIERIGSQALVSLRAGSENGDRRARLAIDLYCRRVKHYIGAYLAEMGGADALIFSGGIGENVPEIRRRICEGLQWLGITLDAQRNCALTPGLFN